MSEAAYSGLALNMTTLGSVTSTFGSTATPKMLERIFGSNWLATLLPYQTAGQSCAYYVDGSKPTTSVFQLCFNGANVLVAKSTIPS